MDEGLKRRLTKALNHQNGTAAQRVSPYAAREVFFALRTPALPDPAPRSDPAPDPGPAKAPTRGTPAYRGMISGLAWTDDMPELTTSLGVLWGEYGWRALLDLMTAFVCQIEDCPVLAPASRDITGAIDLRRLLVIPSEETILSEASEFGSDAEAAGAGLAPHEAFSTALDASKRTFELLTLWVPHLQEAFLAAHNGGAVREQQVFASLFKAPRRGQSVDCIQMTVTIAVVAADVRNRGQKRWPRRGMLQTVRK